MKLQLKFVLLVVLTFGAPLKSEMANVFGPSGSNGQPGCQMAPPGKEGPEPCPSKAASGKNNQGCLPGDPQASPTPTPTPSPICKKLNEECSSNADCCDENHFCILGLDSAGQVKKLCQPATPPDPPPGGCGGVNQACCTTGAKCQSGLSSTVGASCECKSPGPNCGAASDDCSSSQPCCSGFSCKLYPGTNNGSCF